MPICPDISGSHPDQGMTPQDMVAAQAVAARRDEIIMFRDTGCWSRPYIALGHPTKPFHVKGKSSDWGPHAGLVPYNSEFSKAFSKEAIKKGFALNKEAIAGNYARTIPLFVSESFIRDELLVNKGSAGRPPIDRMTQPRDDVMYFFCTKPNDVASLPGEPYVLFGKKRGDGRYQIFAFPPEAAKTNPRQLFLKEAESEPMLAMTVPGSDLPITGDYDLFAVCPSWASYGGTDRKMDPTLDNPQQNASARRTATKAWNVPRPHEVAAADLARRSLAKVNAAFTPEDPDRGNLTARLLAVIGALTAAMTGKYPRVHHNAESGRPFAPGAEDGFPVTTFHPRRGIGGYSFLNATINDIGDLREYFTRLYKGGYYPPRNRAWKMTSLRDDSAVKSQLDNIFQSRGR
jgi:Anthrax toxin LF subunit